MIYATKLLPILFEYFFRLPATIAFSLTPQWRFESTLQAHALKSPLSSLSLALASAKQSAQSPQRLTQALNQAEAAHQKLQQLLFMRSSQASSSFSVQQQVRHVVEWFSMVGHNVHLLSKVDQTNHVALRGNQLLFQQLVELLIENGIHASTVGSLIVVALSVENKSLKLVIQDFGKGMSSMELLVCELNGYTNSADGWGMGLSCARRIVSQFRGELQIRSWEHIGTQIICTLPLDLV